MTKMGDNFRKRYEDGMRTVRILPEDPQTVRDRDQANLDSDLRHLGNPEQGPSGGLMDEKEDE